MGGRLKRIIIAGGGTAGWMTAAALAERLKPLRLEITLVESDAIGTVGVGEATLPHLRFFNQSLGIDERELMAFTSATFKLGIDFRDWGRIGDSYIHPFGDYGQDVRGIPFHQIWARLNATGHARRIDTYSLPVMMCEEGRFDFPDTNPGSLRSTFSYAYQLDATRYAAFLRRFAEARGVIRHEGRILKAELNPESGNITHLDMEDGSQIEGDLFIDCTGFRALLIGSALGGKFVDWTHWLPCDRAVAVGCELYGESVPYTRATARKAGWQWRIPLQHRAGNGYVFSSAHVSEDQATNSLLANLEGPALGDPKVLKFKTGLRDRQWIKNCVSVGLSAGFLEPLESTSIYLIQAGITALVELFPNGSIDPRDIGEFNRVMDLEYERVRDFLVLHYHATERDDSDFWNEMRTLNIPQSLARKMALFRARGIVETYKDGLFLHPSWIAVYLGQRVAPVAIDPRAEALSLMELGHLASIEEDIAKLVAAMPTHEAALTAYCAPSNPKVSQAL